jgi:hypothetical protein
VDWINDVGWLISEPKSFPRDKMMVYTTHMPLYGRCGTKTGVWANAWIGFIVLAFVLIIAEFMMRSTHSPGRLREEDPYTTHVWVAILVQGSRHLSFTAVDQETRTHFISRPLTLHE